MNDFVILDTDQVIFLPAFGNAVVAVQPGKMKASGKPKCFGKKICVKGDEKKVKVANCMYVAPPFVIPGKGDLTIKSLAPNQLSKRTKSNGKTIIIKGAMFVAQFKVSTPAKMPMPPGPPQNDPLPMYVGQGNFITKNFKFKVI